MSVGLALIARNEEHTLPALLASVEGAFDRVVLLDTGSTDQTVDTFQAWARHQTAMTWAVSEFGWCDDFALARQAADRLLMWGDTTVDAQTRGAVAPLVDWTVWADCDDVLHGAGNLRAIADQAAPVVNGFVADYAYAHDEHGNVTCTLRRERMVRAGAGHWTGRVHEAQLIDGATAFVDQQLVRWIHRKQPGAPNSNERNLRILHAWNEAQPDDPRIVGYLGTEHAGRGDHDEAIGYFRQYLQLKTGWDEERCQIHRKLSACLIASGQPGEALDVALQALKVMPSWPDTYLSLAQATYHLREYAKAVEWAHEALRRGQPNTLLIINPTDYTFQPRLVLAGALGALGQVEDAIRVAEEALAIIPGHPELQAGHAHWRTLAKREATAATFAGCAELLIAHDEQLKALMLLEDTLPYYVRDHPRLVGLRSQLRERLHWIATPDAYGEHYETGGSKPEDMIPDDKVTELCDRLPRTRFLAAGLLEQLKALAA